VAALGLSLLPDQAVSSYIITAIRAPEGLDIEKVRKNMQQKYHVQCAGGQKHLKGKILRIGHCGYMDLTDLVRGFTALECALADERPGMVPGASLPVVLGTYRQVMERGPMEA
jgi:aspartate aminotransferase-like enzyme